MKVNIFSFLVPKNHRCGMAGKARDFGALQAGLAGLATTAPPAAAEVSSSIPESKSKGRPKTDTAPLQVRLPSELIAALVKEAAEASIAAGRNVTPQQIILRILEERYRG
jgi:hypothetical protein